MIKKNYIYQSATEERKCRLLGSFLYMERWRYAEKKHPDACIVALWSRAKRKRCYFLHRAKCG